MIWYQLLLWQMSQGKYLRLGDRPVTESDWLNLWIMVQDIQARVSDGH